MLGDVLFGCDYQAELADYRQSDPVKTHIKHRNTRHEVPGVAVVANGFSRPKEKVRPAAVLRRRSLGNAALVITATSKPRYLPDLPGQQWIHSSSAQSAQATSHREGSCLGEHSRHTGPPTSCHQRWAAARHTDWIRWPHARNNIRHKPGLLSYHSVPRTHFGLACLQSGLSAASRSPRASAIRPAIPTGTTDTRAAAFARDLSSAVGSRWGQVPRIAAGGQVGPRDPGGWVARALPVS
jgi:hypothetical protein